MGMSKKEAIAKMGCIGRECEHLDPDGAYTFCKALFTEDMCTRRDKNEKEDRNE